MKPIKLVLKNIGPHLNTTIDFSLLDDFFLIAGETGAGKSFIFDSIIHAIYGEPSKENFDSREKSLVSTLKPDDELPSIEFTFGIGADTYKVFRTPSYQKSTKKTKESATAILYVKHNGEDSFTQILNDPKEISEKMESEIIGLTKDEFEKIVILPQGEFQKFLKMAPGDKKNFLIKIFQNVQIFQRIMKKARADEKAFKDKLKYLENDVFSVKTEIDYENAENKLDELNKSIEELNGIKNKLSKDVTQLTADKEKYSVSYEQALLYSQNLEKQKLLLSKEDEIELTRQKVKAADEALQIKAPYDAKKKAVMDLNEATENLNSINSSLNEAAKVKTELANKSEFYKTKALELKKLELDLKKQEERKNKLDVILQKSQEVKAAEEEFKAANENSASLLNDKLSLVQELQEKTAQKESDCGKILLDLNAKLSELQQDAAKFKTALEKAENNDSLNSEIEQCKVQLKEEELNLEKYNSQKTKLELLKEQNYAFFLAQNLKEEEPCPVCGAVHHPKLASQPVLSSDDKESLNIQDTLETALENAVKLYTQSNSTVSSLKVQIEEKLKNIEVIDTEIKTVAELKSKVTQLNTAETVLKEKIDLCKTIQIKINSLTDKLETAKNTETQLQLKLSGLQKEFEAIFKENFGDIENSAELLKKGELEAEIQKKYLQLKEGVDSLTKEINEYENNYKEISEKVSVLEGKKNAAEEHLSKCSEYEVNATKAFNQALEHSPFETEVQITEALLEKEEIAELNRIIQNYDKQISEVAVMLENSKTKEKPEAIKVKLDSIIENQEKTQTQITETEEKLSDLNNQITILNSKLDYINTKQSEINETQEKLLPIALLNSHINGKTGMDTWAVKLYFSNIVEFANIRYKQLTNGEYEFIFGKSIKEGVKEDEIDFSVYNYTTGKTIHSSALSGGEQFQASISLALGLADVIQSQHSYANIESMFIDEGFATLGISHQNKTIEILRSLNDTRMIGIISHSENIDEEVKSKIVVTKTDGVSSVSIVEGNAVIG